MKLQVQNFVSYAIVIDLDKKETGDPARIVAAFGTLADAKLFVQAKSDDLSRTVVKLNVEALKQPSDSAAN